MNKIVTNNDYIKIIQINNINNRRYDHIYIFIPLISLVLYKIIGT